MKKYYLGLFLIMGVQIASSQTDLPIPQRLPVSITASEFNVYDRGRMTSGDEVLSLNGKKVTGSVFLYQQWHDGNIITADGEFYTGYKLKYDAYNQSVYFLKENESLEIEQKIKQFSLVVPENGKMETYTFLHSDEIKKGRKPFYYEVLVENDMGYLLKLSQKKVVEAQKGLPVADGTKALSLDVTYYYFDKNARLLTRLNANGSNIKDALNIKGDEIRTEGYDFTNELSLKEFFISFFSKRKMNQHKAVL